MKFAASINGSLIHPGQSLNITAVLYNTLGSTNNVTSIYDPYVRGGSGHFPFLGYHLDPSPVSSWNGPYQFIILKGDLSTSALQGLGGSGMVVVWYSYGGETNASSYSFAPDSNIANVTWLSCTVSCAQSTSRGLSSNATAVVDGYWNSPTPTTPNEPAFNDLQTPPDGVFAPGNYTVAVGDEWGDLLALHFQVEAPPSNATTTSVCWVGEYPECQVGPPCTLQPQPTGFSMRVLWDSNMTPVAGAEVSAKNSPHYCGSGLGLEEEAAVPSSSSYNTTSGREWQPFIAEGNQGYSLVVTYANSKFDFYAVIQPSSLTCATLYIPSGRTNVTISESQTTCAP